MSDDPLDPSAIEALVVNGSAALCTFIGIVRDNTDGKLTTHLEYEGYVPMAESELRRIGEEAKALWPEVRLAIAHRLGRLEIGDASVVIVAAADLHTDVQEACLWAIDQLKGRVPIWKKEFGPDGVFWIEGTERQAIVG